MKQKPMLVVFFLILLSCVTLSNVSALQSTDRTQYYSNGTYYFTDGIESTDIALNGVPVTVNGTDVYNKGWAFADGGNEAVYDSTRKTLGNYSLKLEQFSYPSMIVLNDTFAGVVGIKWYDGGGTGVSGVYIYGTDSPQVAFIYLVDYPDHYSYLQGGAWYESSIDRLNGTWINITSNFSATNIELKVNGIVVTSTATKVAGGLKKIKLQNDNDGAWFDEISITKDGNIPEEVPPEGCTEDANCSLCMKCSAGTCANELSSEDTKSECDVSATCSGYAVQGYNGFCDGAGACNTTTIVTDCPTCQVCSAGACANELSSEDLKDDCSVSYSSCLNDYTLQGDNGFCDGIGACDANTGIWNVSAGNVCIEKIVSNWTADVDITTGLFDIGQNSAPSVFYKDSTWFLLSGWIGGNTFWGFNWSGSAWQYDLPIATGLEIGFVSATPTVFYKDSTWYLISGSIDGAFYGSNWTGTEWQSDSGVVTGLTDIGGYSAPSVFYKDSTWYLISGRNDGIFIGFNWTGTEWQSDSGILNGLGDIGDYSAPLVFYKNSTWYLISGSIDGAFYGFNWTGTTWQEDNGIDSGLLIIEKEEEFTGHGIPSVFEKDGEWYLISGDDSGNFTGFKWTTITSVSDSNPTAGVNCGIWSDCISGNISADEYYVGYAGDGTATCVDTDWQSAGTIWNALIGYINVTEHADTCQEVECFVDSDCSLCMKCDAGTCANELSSEDTKAECETSPTCANAYTLSAYSGLCDGAGACDTVSLESNVSAGNVCDAGADSNPSSGTNCGIWSDCVATQTSADEYYVGYAGDGTATCVDTDWQSKGTFWNATAGYEITTTEHTDTCSEADAENPVVSITYPTDLYYLDGTVGYPLKATGTVTDNIGVIATWINDSRFTNEGTNTAFDFRNNTGLADGTYTITIYSNDSVGNLGSDSVSFYLDTVNPLVNLEAGNSFLADNSSVLNSADPLDVVFSIFDDYLTRGEMTLKNSSDATILSLDENATGTTINYDNEGIDVSGWGDGTYTVSITGVNHIHTTIRDFSFELCTSDWNCDGYDSCNTTNLEPCNSVMDMNTCGFAYTGDYSEFSPLLCNYCTSAWNTTLGSCISGSQTVTYAYTNTCCADTGIPSDCNKPANTAQSCGTIIYRDASDLIGAFFDGVVKILVAINSLIPTG